MNLKNKNIAEGMRVSNGKYELRVVSWDKSYTDCLLNYLDSKGNRYVVAQNYELSGTEKDPQIEWINGRYFTANSDDEAFEEYLKCLGEANEYDISESKKSSRKSLKESAKPINEKNVQKFVDDLNRICHDEFDDELFTSKYGNLYDFRIQYVGDVPNNWLIYDYNGTFDWFEDKLAKKVVEKLLKQNGWYGEPCSHYSEFCVDIL